MTNDEYFKLFSEAMKSKKIVTCENTLSRDDYHIYGMRKTASGYSFFCLIKSFFRADENTAWYPDNLSSLHVFEKINGGNTQNLVLTDKTFIVPENYHDLLATLPESGPAWQTLN